ncbi:PREDICTED: succinate dehydrogenase assembly factor 4, mitochondrial isoform X3 [Ficedula albicollis]|uniref:succinate dehydrogenase assembly factor 4, mitochondrial isoform X3 n=1 Tax=Ficedula albicollis TaxID=59894 RepID=UPI0007AD956F|nr:PREDICTED: succinate dehydrogenase assembly factor 4, mitochondrial isoform X3 [Ficedula albicollis]
MFLGPKIIICADFGAHELNVKKESSLLCHVRSSSSSKPGGRSGPAKQPLKKPKLPVGRFDEPEESSMEKEPLEMPVVKKAALQHFFGAVFLLFYYY